MIAITARCESYFRGSATSADVPFPWGIAVDNSGNVYIASSHEQRVRKVDTSGVITTVAGTGTQGYSGDGGPAVAAQLNSPSVVALDDSGNLFIGEYHAIRKVDMSSGIITTVAGTRGDDGSGYSGDGGIATDARLKYPYGLAVDSVGNIYIADRGNHAIRKVDTSGIITTVIGGNGLGSTGDGGLGTQAKISTPYNIGIDSDGNLFITDNGYNRVRKYYPSTGIIVAFAGISNQSGGYSGDEGQATEARIDDPYGVATDATGNVYIADFGNNRIRRISPP